MKIRYTVSAAGLTENYYAGLIADVEDSKAKKLIKIGHAEALVDMLERETATKKYSKRGGK